MIPLLRPEAQSQRKLKIFGRPIKGVRRKESWLRQFVRVITRQLEEQDKHYNFKNNTSRKQKETIPYLKKGLNGQ